MQFTYNDIAKEFMIDVCMNTVWGLDVLKDTYPEQIKWRTLSLKIEDYITHLAILLKTDAINDYQCKRFYINIWKHLGKLEVDYFQRFEDIVMVLYKESKIKKGDYKRKNCTNVWENISFVFAELSTEQDEIDTDLMKNRLSNIDIENAKTIIKNSSNTKSIKSIVNEIKPKGYDLYYSEPQLENLHEQLIGNFIDRNTELKHFINAFDGKVLAEEFKPLKWIKNKTVLSLFVGLLNHENKWKTAEIIFENTDRGNLRKSFNNGDGLDKHKSTIEFFKKILP